MLKDKKLEYQRQLEEYLEEQKVYEIFEDMMKGLIVNKPKDPIQYLLTKLQSPETRKIIIVGPPGSKRKEIALSLAEYFQDDSTFVVSVGDLLNKEISKKSEHGKKIVESRKTYSYVKDDIVIELVKNQIEQLDKEQKSWIIEGFPRTRLQALALHKMGIIPDKFIMLDVENSQSIDKVKSNLLSKESPVQFPEDAIDSVADKALAEYKVQIEGVKDTCKGQITEIDGNKAEGVILEEIVRILKLHRSKGPRRPPRILLMGPPGCGKTVHGRKLADKFKLQYIRVSQIIKDIIRTEPRSQRAKDLKEKLDTAQPFPDSLVIDIVTERLSKPDCQINGWILDGCPTNPEQIMKLGELGVIPSLVITLDQSDSLVYEKIEQRRFDPADGKFYNLFKDEVPKHVLPRLIQQNEHTHPVVKQRLMEYRNFLATVENEYRKHIIRINAEEEAEQVFLNLCDAVENTV